MSRSTKPPAYRRRVIGQRVYAYVTLPDAQTGKRRDVCLGAYGSEESRQRYSRLLAEWESAGRKLPTSAARACGVSAEGPTVSQLCQAYWDSIQARYVKSHRQGIGAAIKVFRGMYGDMPATAIGPNALRVVRHALVTGDPEVDPPRKPWSRTVANRGARWLVAIYKWGAAHELVPASVHQALRTLESLRAGETEAKEPTPIRPVPDEFVTAVLPYLRPQVRAMVELQRMTGMRPGEVTIMRTCDFDTSGKIWTYTPERHKTQHHGHRRIIHIGPRGQEILRPWLRPVLDEYLFQPRDVVAAQLAARHEARETPLKYGNRPGTNRKANPRCNAGDHYDACSYRRAITRACDQADAAARKKAKKDERLIPRWHPNQLRHNHATTVRREFGAEAAQIALGHQNLRVTEIYAERDQAVAERVAKALG